MRSEKREGEKREREGEKKYTHIHTHTHVHTPKHTPKHTHLALAAEAWVEHAWPHSTCVAASTRCSLPTRRHCLRYRRADTQRRAIVPLRRRDAARSFWTPAEGEEKRREEDEERGEERRGERRRRRREGRERREREKEEREKGREKKGTKFLTFERQEASTSTPASTRAERALLWTARPGPTPWILSLVALLVSSSSAAIFPPVFPLGSTFPRACGR